MGAIGVLVSSVNLIEFMEDDEEEEEV